MGLLDDVPGVFAGMAEFAACDAGTEAVITDTDGLVLESVGEVVFAFGHSTDKTQTLSSDLRVST